MPEKAQTPPTPQPPKKRHRLLKAIVWIFSIFIILIVAVYFVGTSSAFLKGFILPKVSKSLNADITITDASIHPFKEVVLHNLVVKTTGDQPLVTAQEVHARYSLMDIIGGKIHVDEAVLSSPKIVLIENADGTSNLDPLTKGQKEKPKTEKEKAEQPSKSSKPPEIDIKKIALNDATVQQIKIYTSGKRDVTELSHVNVTLDDLKNGQSAKLALNADVKMDQNPPTGTNGMLEAKIKGSFSFALGVDLKPTSVQGNTHLEVTRAEGGLSELRSLVTDLDCDVTPTEIKQVAVHFAKGVTRLGEVRVNGPFDMNKMEGKIAIQALGIDKQVLNLAGAASGIDFGSTTLNSTNEIQLAKAGSEITAVGQVSIGKLQLTRAKQTTPTMDLVARYNVSVDNSGKTAQLRELTVSGTEKGNQVLQGELTSPMTFAWGSNSTAVGDSTLNLAVNGLDLMDWKAFVGEIAPAGTVNVKMQLVSQQAGKQLTFSLNSQVANLTANLGTNHLSQVNVTLQVNGRATDLKHFNLTDYQLQLAQQNQQLVTVSGAGNYDKGDNGNDTADLQVNVKTALGRLLQIVQPDAGVFSGTADLKVHIVQREGTQAITGNLALSDLTGKVGQNQFNAFGATMDLDVAKTPQEIQIHRVAGQLTENGKPGGTFDLSGTYATNNAAQITAKLTDFNQEGLRAFLEPMLADKKLVSIAINGTTTVQLNPQGDSALKGDIKVSNLVVSDPKNQIPATPLEAKMAMDVSVQKQVADVKQFQITLTPTQRAKNELQLTGRVDMSNTNGMQGNLKLAADSLDFTSYYDLFSGENKTPEKNAAKAPKQTAKPAAAPASAPAEAEKEPEAKQLPFRNFTAEINIGHCYLREAEIANLQTTTKIDGGHIVVKPLQLALNGAPVNANVDLDLGVPGYKYDTSFSAKAIPLAPLVNSFAPERKGQIGGTLTANAKLSGAGTTGASLQKTLTGDFDVNSTNLNLAIDQVKQPIIKLIVNLVGAIPELLHNPLTAGAGLFEDTTGLRQGGLTAELQKSPIDAITARGKAGSGRVDLQEATVQSRAFRADANGKITLAKVLTNSPVELPIRISLSQAVAKQVGLGGGDTNSAYVKLPDFILVKGTIGKPKPDTTKLLVLASALGKGILGSDSTTGSAIQSLEGLLGAGSKSTNAPSGTQSHQSSSSLLKGLGGVLSGALSQTNAPATNSPRR